MSAVLALAGWEARRIVRHPLMVAGLAIGAVIGTVAWRGGNSDFELHGILAGQAVLPLATATLITAQIVSARGARDHVEGEDDALPLSPARRTGALLLAALAAPAAALMLMAPIWLTMLRPDLSRTIDGHVWRADLFDLAQPLTLVLGVAWLGVGLGRLNTRTPVAVLLAMLLTWSPLVWVSPMIAINRTVGDPQRDLLATIPWQVAFLFGLALIGGTLAFARTSSRRAAIGLPVAIAFTAAAGIARF